MSHFCQIFEFSRQQFHVSNFFRKVKWDILEHFETFLNTVLVSEIAFCFKKKCRNPFDLVIYENNQKLISSKIAKKFQFCNSVSRLFSIYERM